MATDFSDPGGTCMCRHLVFGRTYLSLPEQRRVHLSSSIHHVHPRFPIDIALPVVIPYQTRRAFELRTHSPTVHNYGEYPSQYDACSHPDKKGGGLSELRLYETIPAHP